MIFVKANIIVGNKRSEMSVCLRTSVADHEQLRTTELELLELGKELLHRRGTDIC